MIGPHPTPQQRRAITRFFRITAAFHGTGRAEVRKQTHPVKWADRQTAYHDARAALCFTLGRALDEIHPVTGHDLRRSA